MAYNRNYTAVVGGATKESQHARVSNNIEAIRTVGLHIHLGGSSTTYIPDTSWVDIPNAAIIEIDGTNLTTNHLELYFEATFKGENADNQVSVRLYNITDAGAVADSQVNLTADAFDRQRSVALSVPASTKEYKAQCLTAAAATPLVVASAQAVIK